MGLDALAIVYPFVVNRGSWFVTREEQNPGLGVPSSAQKPASTYAKASADRPEGRRGSGLGNIKSTGLEARGS